MSTTTPSAFFSGGIEDVLDNISDAFIALDADWRILFANRSYLKLVQPLYPSKEALLGYSLWEKFPDIVDQESGHRYRQAMELQQPDTFELFYQPLKLWLEVRVQPSPDYLAIYIQDVTQSRRSEEKRRLSEERYRTLFDSIDEGFCVIQVIFDGGGNAVDYRFLETNPAFVKQTGIVDALGRSMRQIAPELEDHWYATYGQVARTGEPTRYVNEARALGRWFDVYAFRVGEPTDHRVAIIFKDVTERNRADRRLQRRNELLSLLSELARDLLAATDPREMVRQLYEKVARRLSLDVFFNYMVDAEGGGLTLDVCGGIDEDTRHAFAHLEFGQAVCGTVAKEGNRIVVADVQNCGYEKAGGVRSMGVQAYACHPLFVGDRFIGTLSFGSRSRLKFEDDELEFMQTISNYVAMAKERIRIEEERQNALRREQAASAAKDRFLAILSHELRTPLTPVLMTASARAMDQQLTTELRSDMAMIRRNVELETKLIDDLLDLSRITSGKLVLRTERMDLNAAMRHVCGICHPQAQEKGQKLHCHFNDNLGSVQADPARLQQVLWNLVKNAIKFTPDEGDIHVTTAQIGPNRLIVQVRDTGIGLAPETVSRIFDAFEQGDQRITRQFGGLGLGLAISKALVELHGGTIRAESEGLDRGSTFTVELPAEKPIPQLLLAQAAPAAKIAGVKPRLLLVEDHYDSALVLSTLLNREGFEVSVADSGEQALAVAERERFDIMVSDIGLPDMSGYELMRKVLQIRQVKGIAMSGFGMEEDIRKSHEAGFAEHLVKPVDFDRLKQAIEKVAAA